MGDGLKVRIWGDSWIPRESFFKVLSPIPQGWSHALTVWSLIVDLERLVWDEGLIRNVFREEQIELIMSIPLSLFQPLDSLIWTTENNGEFTTRSGYHVARSM